MLYDSLSLQKKLIFNSAFALLNFLSLIFLYNSPATLTIIIAAIAALALFFWHSRTTNIIFVLGTVLGVVGESIAISIGAWNYAFANFFGLPLWAVLLWGNIVAFSYQMGILIGELFHSGK